MATVDGYALSIGETEVAGNITSIAQGSGSGLMPNFFNATNPSGTLIVNFTDTKNATITGHTGDNSFFDPITEPIERLYAVGELALEFLFGGFIINVMNAFTTSLGVDFPPEWNTGFQLLIGFVNIFYIIYIILGRSIPAFN